MNDGGVVPPMYHPLFHSPGHILICTLMVEVSCTENKVGIAGGADGSFNSLFKNYCLF